jgi:hypothetical protein
MTPRFHQPSEDSSKRQQYQRLLQELKTMIEETQAQDLDLSDRPHLLTCSGCGAYEDVTAAEDLVVYSQDGEPLPYPDFLLIDGKQRILDKRQPIQHLTTYTFICPACGMYQSAIIREKFTDEADTPNVEPSA